MKTTKWPERLTEHPANNTNAEPTGKYWISTCCTASVYEWKHEGQLYRVGSVAGHGYTCHQEPLVDCREDQFFVLNMDPAEVWQYDGRDVKRTA